MHDFIEHDLLDEISTFEIFLHSVGFKRIDGRIFGLLCLSNRPLTSEEIEKTLELSQSATSVSLKKLEMYGAVNSCESSTTSRAKTHFVSEDSLSIIATLFRKREQENIDKLHTVTKKLLNNDKIDGLRKDRLQSILYSCQMADAIISFIIDRKNKVTLTQHQKMASLLPKALDFLSSASSGTETISYLKDQMTQNFKKKFWEQLGKFSGDTQ